MARKGVGPKFLKHTVSSFNFLLCVSGLILASTMGLLALDGHFGLVNGPNAVLVILMAVGGVMVFVGVLGCFGSARESEGLLLAYIACLFVLFMCELAASSWLCHNGPTLTTETKAFYDSLYDMAEGRSTIASTVRRVFHGTLNCCGGTTPTANRTRGDVCPPRTESQHVVSCHERVKDLVRHPIYFMSGYSAVFGVIAFAMSCGMSLCLLYTKEVKPRLRQRGDLPGPGPRPRPRVNV